MKIASGLIAAGLVAMSLSAVPAGAATAANRAAASTDRSAFSNLSVPDEVIDSDGVADGSWVNRLIDHPPDKARTFAGVVNGARSLVAFSSANRSPLRSKRSDRQR